MDNSKWENRPIIEPEFEHLQYFDEIAQNLAQMEEESNDQEANQIKCPFISATRQMIHPKFELQQDLVADENVSKVNETGLKAGVQDEQEE